MSARRMIHWSLILFGIVVGVSFGYGGDLMHFRWMPREEIGVGPPSAGNVQSLVWSAAPYREAKHVEQALITYRKALTLDPTSVDAQLGLARGELMAGRESVAAREYERGLALDHGNATALQQLARIYSHQRETWSQSEGKYRDYLRSKSDEVFA